MDESLPANQPTGPLESGDSFAAARQRAREILAAQRKRLQQMEAGLEKQIEAITEDLARDHQEVHVERDELHRHAAQVQRQREQLSTDQQEWEQAQEAALHEQQAAIEHLRQKEKELQRREREAAEREAQWRKTQRTIETTQQELAEEAAELARAKRRLEEKQRAIDEEREQLAQEQAETSNQRRRIAHRLQQQRADLQADIDRQHAEIKRLSQRDHQQLTEQTSQLERAQEDLAAARAQARQLQNESARQRAEQTQLSGDLDRAQSQLQQVQAELATLRAEHRLLSEEHAESQASLAARTEALASATEGAQQLETLQRKFDMALDDARELKRRNAELQEELATRPTTSGNEPQLATLLVERDGLLERLAEAEARAKRSVTDSSEQRKFQELQRRFELAVEDLRELKTRNSELEEELAAAKQHRGAAHAASSGGKLDWEAQKRQLLASLEADFDADDPVDRRERLTIQGTIDITDEVVANKDREIAELKQRLTQQSGSSNDAITAAAAVAELLDHDEVIRHERERLAQLQSEWEAKLRQAEIDVSLERAKLGRERAALEEKQQELQSRLGDLGTNGENKATGNGQPAKSSRGRWLTRLGLKDSDGEQ